ncbi:hypothetical protein LBK6_03280 [Leptospira borgpetersenii serovar Hardjo]|nr:hypothetical protein LBK6_03280 [Leptospira borgpetersenii serovar Hardjo]AWV69325.1 hypothetical protein B9T54_03545 [Leptospira borgpetersenii serovar Hardjo-bovis]TQE51634.1 hypothetical protein FFZ95_13540 [Leptospira borgpetersenii]AMX60659.1 hypothetical protein LBK9_03225 [Leptospira borgpetersenii serovar Hardjo]AMX63903.1 hypothetical protein LBK30_03265 [Leptospira borgpetersenii serovar Hardjo]
MDRVLTVFSFRVCLGLFFIFLLLIPAYFPFSRWKGSFALGSQLIGLGKLQSSEEGKSTIYAPCKIGKVVRKDSFCFWMRMQRAPLRSFQESTGKRSEDDSFRKV